MKIAFYKGKHGNVYDRIVCASTFSEYSHVELVLDDGLSYSASHRDNGVRSKNIHFDEKWDLFKLNKEYDQNAIKYWFSLNKDNKYDYRGAIASAVCLNLAQKDKSYCSNVAALMLGILPERQTPGSLHRNLVKHNLIKTHTSYV
jgi:hypothetical protein